MPSFSKRKFRRFLFLPFVLASFFLPFFHQDRVRYEACFVKSVADGDTIELSNGQDVRYLGIDAPETSRLTPSGKWAKVDEPFGQEAKKANEALVLGQVVRLEFDVQREDKYQRLLAYCFAKKDGREVLVQEELLRQGLVYLYTSAPNVKYVDRMVAALKEAKGRRAGVWSQDLAIDATEASKYLRQRKLVEGTVLKTRSSGKVIRLEMDGLLVVIFKKDLEFFARENIAPAKFYKNKKIRIYGLIKEYRGETEMIVSNPWQVEVVS